jgi:uncharacterized membrane protein
MIEDLIAYILNSIEESGHRPVLKEEYTMMKAFNAFQLVACFAAAPFGIQWLSTATFTGAPAAFWVGIVVYVVGFFGMCVCVHDDV